MFGFFNICKPPGPTSHDIVDQVRRRLGQDVKVGHAGTLDPFAQGVLVICVGPATRLASDLHEQPKGYRAQVRLGAVSDTDDPQGQVTVLPESAAPDEPAVRAVLGQLVGQVQQVPPAHSAVHVAGRRAYKLARAGQEVDLPARTVTIHSLELLGYNWPMLEIDVRCGGGTYIRSLARDIGAALGVGGYCQALTRTAVGPFALADAVAVDEMDPTRHLVDPLVVLSHLPKVTLDDQQLSDVSMGRAIALPQPGQWPLGQEIVLVSPRGGLAAIARVLTQNQAGPVRVFVAR